MQLSAGTIIESNFQKLLDVLKNTEKNDFSGKQCQITTPFWQQVE
jgi:hypothetical protein